MIQHKTFKTLEEMNSFIKMNNIQRNDIISSEKKTDHWTSTEPVVDFTGGRDVTFVEGRTYTEHHYSEVWELTYYG